MYSINSRTAPSFFISKFIHNARLHNYETRDALDNFFLSTNIANNKIFKTSLLLWNSLPVHIRRTNPIDLGGRCSGII